MSQSSQRPPADLLSGIRVLDLTNILSGPYATYQMGLLGAEVIKVENPKDGDLARKLGASPVLNAQLMGTSFLAQNAGKLSVTVDLKHPEGKALFRDLVASADVLVENFRPGVMDRLGFSHEALRAANPGLIYCAISGFGQNGPLAGNPAYDQIVQGMSGVTKDIPPFITTSNKDYYAGINKIGLSRRGFTPEQITAVHEACRILFQSNLNYMEGCDRVEAELPPSAERDMLVQFIRSSKRGCIKQYVSDAD